MRSCNVTVLHTKKVNQSALKAGLHFYGLSVCVSMSPGDKNHSKWPSVFFFLTQAFPLLGANRLFCAYIAATSIVTAITLSPPRPSGQQPTWRLLLFLAIRNSPCCAAYESPLTRIWRVARQQRKVSSMTQKMADTVFLYAIQSGTDEPR